MLGFRCYVGFSLDVAGGGGGVLSSCGAQVSHCSDFSSWGVRALGCMSASVVGAHGLSSCGSLAVEHRLSSYSTWA